MSSKKLPPKPPAKWKFSFLSPLSMFTFSWVSSLLTYGNATTLKQDDLPECYEEEQPSFLFNTFSKAIDVLIFCASCPKLLSISGRIRDANYYLHQNNAK